MAVRHAQAIWEGTLSDGKGRMQFGTIDGAFTYASRFEEGEGTNPEELLGAAHAGCFSMALSSGLGKAGFSPKRVSTRATVHLGRVDGKSRIIRIDLETEAEVPEISAEQFQEIAEATKTGCPVSAALAAVEITLQAHLIR